MNHCGIIASLFCSASLALSAHDADTLAFYAFKEGAGGSSLLGNAIINAAGEEFAGEVSVAGGTVQYSADAPGAYVFDSEAHGVAAICEYPQSVRFSGNSTDGSQYVSFSGLGTAVSSNDDFTVEFFFKYADGDGGANRTIPVLAMNCGLIYNPSDGSLDGAGMPGLFGIMIHGNPDRYFDAYMVDRNHHRARSDANPSGSDSAYPTVGFADGLWHHAAVVYVKSTKKYTVYIDYGVKLTASVARETDKTVLETPEAMLLGNGGFRGLISCLRISKCARETGSFLRCSSLSTYSRETVFHWSFDDADEIAQGTLASPVFPDPRSGQFIARYRPFRNGYGTVNGFGTGESAVFPICTNEIPFRRCTEVMSGDARLTSSTNSVAMTVALAEGETDTVGTGLRISGENYDPISGSFTLEGWFKMDYETWKSAVVDSGLNIQRTALMGVNYGSSYTASDLSLSLVYKSDGFRLKLNVYQANKSYDPDGVNLGAVCQDDAWHHFAVVYEAESRSFSAYVDGEEKQELRIVLESPFVFRSSEPYREFLVGWGLSARQYAGLIDEVRCVRRALSPAEFISFERRKYGLRFTVR